MKKFKDEISSLKDENETLRKQLEDIAAKYSNVEESVLNAAEKITNNVTEDSSSILESKSINGIREGADRSNRDVTVLFEKGGAGRGNGEKDRCARDVGRMAALFEAKEGPGRGHEGSTRRKDTDRRNGNVSKAKDGPASGIYGEVGKRNALFEMFSKTNEGIKCTEAGGKVKNNAKLVVAVTNSSRPIPLPPILPNTVLISAPPLPGQNISPRNDLKMRNIAPKVKMRSIFWNKINGNQVQNTVWSEIEKPTLDWIRLESEFFDPKGKSCAPVAKLMDKKSDKPEIVSLFDGKRTQNVSIAVGKLRKSTTEIAEMCIRLDGTLDSDTVDILISMVPSKEEESSIMDFDGDNDLLDTPGKLFSELIKIPHLLQRLEAVQITLQWGTEMQYIFQQIEILQHACAELSEDECQRGLFRTLAIVLATGNYMNGNTSKGQAQAVKLDVLLKLENIKCSEGHGTLMHFIVDQMRKLYPDVPFYTKWNSTWLVEKVKFSFVKSNSILISKYLLLYESVQWKSNGN